MQKKKEIDSLLDQCEIKVKIMRQLVDAMKKIEKKSDSTSFTSISELLNKSRKINKLTDEFNSIQEKVLTLIEIEAKSKI